MSSAIQSAVILLRRRMIRDPWLGIDGKLGIIKRETAKTNLHGGPGDVAAQTQGSHTLTSLMFERSYARCGRIRLNEQHAGVAHSIDEEIHSPRGGRQRSVTTAVAAERIVA